MRMYILGDNGKLYKGGYSVPLGSVKNDSIYQKQILGWHELGKILKTDKPNTELLVSITAKKRVAALVLIEDNTHSAPYYDKKDRSREEVRLVGEGEWTFVPSMILNEPGQLLAGRFNMSPVYVNTYSMEVKPHTMTEEEQAACVRR